MRLEPRRHTGCGRTGGPAQASLALAPGPDPTPDEGADRSARPLGRTGTLGAYGSHRLDHRL
jgi:hypothetical protein